MRRGITTLLCAVALVCVSLLVEECALAQRVVSHPLIGIDHMPLVVKSVELASQTYSRLGFALKPGRFHEDGIRNVHVKFPDGAGIELITTGTAKDALTSRYIELLSQGEGPVYLGFHARNTELLLSALDAGGIGYSRGDGLVQPSDPRLSFIFFVRGNRSNTDLPAHFAHANSAVAMTEVWIATSDTSSLMKLLTAVGAVSRKETVFVPEPTMATVFTVENGRVVLLPQAHQLIHGRPVVGASFQVSDLGAVHRALVSTNIPSILVDRAGRSPRILVPPEAAHGIWLGFSQR